MKMCGIDRASDLGYVFAIIVHAELCDNIIKG
jgi:hypothetical protein